MMAVETEVQTKSEARELREYFCRMCPEKGQGYNIPKGWFIVRKNNTGDDNGPRTLGLYHNSECLATDVLSNELRITPQHARVLMVANRSR